MSKQYDSYIDNHVRNVLCAFDYIYNRGPEDLGYLFPNLDWWRCCKDLHLHDKSKWTREEYKAYDAFFYPDSDKCDKYSQEEVEAIKQNFDYAWLHHIHNNPHHWQYWLLQEDDPAIPNVPKALDIPDRYIIEMICDWWSFSWSRYFQILCVDPEKANKELYEVFNWYENHKNKMILHPNARNKIERLLDWIRNQLDSEDAVDKLD